MQKDYVEIRLGCLSNGTGGNFAGQVFDKDGLCPTLTDMQGGGRQPHIVEVQKLNDVNFVYGRDADVKRLCNAVKDEEQHLCKLNKMPQGELSSLDDAEIYDIDAPVASTVTARYYKGIGAHKDTMVLQSRKVDTQTIEQQIVADLDYPSSETRRGRVINKGQISPTLTTENIPSVIELGNPDFYNFLYEIDGDIYLIRIRKLTPQECWKLMDFSDEDFEKAAAVNSNTQLYKQAGNSIVKNVLVAIMGQLFEGKEDVYRKV